MGFTVPVADLAEQGQGLLVVAGSLRVAAQPLMDNAEVAQCTGFSGPVSGLAVQRQRLLEVVSGLLVAAHPPGDRTETGQRGRLGTAVTGLAGRTGGVTVDGDRFGEVAASVEVAEQDSGQAGGLAGPAAGGGLRGDRQHGGPL